VDPFAFEVERIDWPGRASRFESGTPPVPSAYAALAALRLHERIGADAVAAQVDRLVALFQAEVEARGFALRTPTEPQRRGPLVVVPSTDARVLVSRLAERGIVSSHRGDGLRVSFHAYNNEEDVVAVIAALEAEAALVQRAATS
jgi:selenocysteine lyase/cysteine desulfurase